MPRLRDVVMKRQRVSHVSLRSLFGVASVAIIADDRSTGGRSSGWKSRRGIMNGSDIETQGGRKVHTWVVYPEVDHPATTVIVIHENRGLTDWVRGVADQLAEAGYVAVAPDLLSGTAPGGGNTPEFGSEDKARNGIGKLPQEQVTADFDAVFEYAKKMPAGNKVVAVGGFCWGGGQTFDYATHNPEYRGRLRLLRLRARRRSQLQEDQGAGLRLLRRQRFPHHRRSAEVEKRMKQLGKKYEPVIYKGAGHGFMRQGEMTADKDNADRKARDEAWERWKKVLADSSQQIAGYQPCRKKSQPGED